MIKNKIIEAVEPTASRSISNPTKKITKVTLVSQDDMLNFITEVNKHLSLGWCLRGPMKYYQHLASTKRYVQMMVWKEYKNEIVEYTIVEHYDLSSMTKIVNEKLAAGWICQGGVSSALNNSGYPYYIQAMIFKNK